MNSIPKQNSTSESSQISNKRFKKSSNSSNKKVPSIPKGEIIIVPNKIIFITKPRKIQSSTYNLPKNNRHKAYPELCIPSFHILPRKHISFFETNYINCDKNCKGKYKV